MLKTIALKLQSYLDYTRKLDFIALLALRLYLVPIFWMAGTNKLMNIESTAYWFGHSLGLPFPTVMAYAAGLTEAVGAVLLLIGLGVRWISIPLMFVMIVAAFAVHWDNGWLAISASHSDAAQRLQEFLTWLEANYPQHHGHITELGQPVMLNNGIEFAVTYFVMLLVLFFYGAGKYLSLDYWFNRYLKKAN